MKFARNKLVTNSSSSCFILWDKAKEVDDISKDIIYKMGKLFRIKPADLVPIKDCLNDIEHILEDEYYTKFVEEKLKEGYNLFCTITFSSAFGQEFLHVENEDNGLVAIECNCPL